MVNSATANSPWRVAVVDDDPDTRLYIRDILQSAKDLTLAGEFASGFEALNSIPRMKPDGVLMDIRMPGLNGIECLKRLKRMMVCLKIIMITAVFDGDAIGASLQAGADGYLIKPVSAEQCLATLRSAGKFQTTVSPKYEPSGRPHGDSALPLSRPLLTPRQVQVIEKLANGRLDKEIADELGISETVVHKQVHKIYLKFHVHNRVEAVGAWLNGNGIRNRGDLRS